MNEALIILKIYYEALGIKIDNSEFVNRKILQKSMYLAQALGVDLGYRFHWHIAGVYSKELSRDYHELVDKLATVASKPDSISPSESINNKLNVVKELITPRLDEVDQVDWLEILSSIHYLKHIERLNNRNVKSRIESEKPQLMDHYDSASTSLSEFHVT